ncbi:lipoprotein [Streptococcus criceti]|uniref:Uncharacterized protein n=1 Tax=Streptococcus criceti HS-6 TaxID=873449 RepID=G5JN59_STRCG|nr:hypothetical protein [Streptococcus criceti]EHI74727.1 hypothetical protein STRCR_1394 [Streptococcus criceti HS-6]SUN43363.1 lipoprotein [Streptococcus criceti]
MKKSTKITLFSLAALAILAGIGGTLMVANDFNSRFEAFVKAKREQQAKEAEKKKQEEKMTPHERQLAYLKKHQQKIIDLVKKSNPKVESVQIDWKQTKWEEPGMFQKNGNILIFGKVNNIEDSDWRVDVPVNDDDTIDINGIGIGQNVTVGGDFL